MSINLFGRSISFTPVWKSKEQTQEIVPVADIKEYLVKEYERVNQLKDENEMLREKINEQAEVNLKYDATLVTLDEYSKRLERAEAQCKHKDRRIAEIQREKRQINDQLNSYKIKLNNAALEKEDIEDEIIKEIEKRLISRMNSHKGKMSKAIACEIIVETLNEKTLRRVAI